MSHSDQLKDVLGKLLKRRLSESLERVDVVLAQWKAGELSLFETHNEVVRHTARAEKIAQQLAVTEPQKIAGLVKQAYDVDLISRDEVIAITGRSPEAIEQYKAHNTQPDKANLVRELLEKGPVLVHIDATKLEVSVPDRVRSERLVLRFGYNLRPMIHNLSVNEEALSGVLSFGGVPHQCFLPWNAIYAVFSEIDQGGMVWPDDVPLRVVEELSRAEAAVPNEKSRRTSDVARPAFLSVIEDDDSELSVRAETTGVNQQKKKARPNHLKLVK